MVKKKKTIIKKEKEYGFMNLVKEGASYIFQIISAGIVPQITKSTDIIIKNIEKKMMRLEEKMLRKLSSHMIILFGGIFFVLGIFFFLTEFLDWSKAAAFLSIGITAFVIGLMLKLIK